MDSASPDNSNAYESCTVCILSAEQNIIGLGFLVSSKHVVTCAHVVADALGISGKANELPNAEVTINFPFHQERGNFSTKVVIWQPEELKDVACLEFIGKQPTDFVTAPYRSDINLWGRKFRAFGFPGNVDTGMWVHGTMNAPIPAGWIQVEPDGNSGLFIDSGFSGTPVWDDALNCVVGIVVAKLQSKDRHVAYVIPIEKLSISFNHPLGQQPARLQSVNLYHARTNYKLEQNFTGRSLELRKLSQWFNTPNLPILELNGGEKIGKTTLAYYWLHYYAAIPKDWTVLWLSFDMPRTSLYLFASQLISNPYFKLNKSAISKDYLSTLNQFIYLMRQQKILFVMDQFELQLFANKKLKKAYSRAYSNKKSLMNREFFASKRNCVDKYVASFLKTLLSLQSSKVIIISRVKIKDLENEDKQPFHGCHRETLDVLESQDAVDFLRYQGVRQGDDKILLDVCKKLNNNPNTLRILSNVIANDKKAPGDISVANRLHVKSLFQLYNSRGFQFAMSQLSPTTQNIIRTSIRTAARSSILNFIIQTVLRTWTKTKTESADNRNQESK